MSSQLFINPYNFIPFGETIGQKRKSREAAYRGKEQLVSGWLTVTLNTCTPLIIPDGAHPRYWDVNGRRYIASPDENQKKKLHKEYRFLRIPDSGENEQKHDGETDIPVIPGSELRGMLRSVYEAATDSCVPFLLDDKPISQRVPTFGSLRRRGLLAYEKVSKDSDERRWVLYSTKAETVEVVVEGNTLKYPDGGLVSRKNGTFVPNKGWLQYNIPVNTRDPYHIAYLTENEVMYTWDFQKEDGLPDDEKNEEPYRALKSALNRQGRGKNAKGRNEIPNKNIAEALEKAKSGGENKVPVYYFMVKRGDQTLVYLSNSAIGRIAQRRKWKEIMGVHAPCEHTDQLCPACLLFGTVQDQGLKGHVRFTDAVPQGELKTETHTLQILGEPRTSAFEFYLRKPAGEKVTYWNFDFYGTKVQDQNGKDHTEYHDLEQATPRGRKMYWHGPVAPDAPKGNMNATMEAVNGSFCFRIYFEEISRGQLQDLIWVITLGENQSSSTKQHKLGHARPLGYGSVKLIVNETVIRSVQVQDGALEVRLDKTEEKAVSAAPGTALEKNLMENIRILCDTRSVPENVPLIYPLALDRKQKENIFTWFAGNRTNPDRLKVLPEPVSESKTLDGSWNHPFPASAGMTSDPQRGQGSRSLGGAGTEKGGTAQAIAQEGREYRVKIRSAPRQARNINFYEYDVEVLGEPAFRGKPCTMTAHKSKRLSKGQEVSAKLFMKTIFNMVR